MEAHITNRDELIAHIFHMLDEQRSQEWENGSARVFLETMAAWLHETRPQGAAASGAANDPMNWQLCAEALMAGRG